MQLIRLLSAGLSLLLLASCTTVVPERLLRSTPVSGKWVNSNGDLLVFGYDRRFSLYSIDRSKPEAQGDFTVSGKRLQLIAHGGRGWAPGNRGSAVYRFQKQENTLWLRLVSAPARTSASQLSKLWRRP